MKAESYNILVQLERSAEDIIQGRVRKSQIKNTQKRLADDVMLQLKRGIEDLKAGRVKRVR